MIHRSPLPDIEIPDVHLTEHVLRRAADLSEKAALIEGSTGRVLTFGALDDGVRRLAGGLVARGFNPGDVVALMAPNVPEYAVVFHGIAMAGGVVTTMNPTYTEREVRHQLVDAGAGMLVTIPMLLEVAREAITGTSVTEIYVLGEDEEAPSVTELFGEPLLSQVDVDLDQTVVLPYSSGTTGISKGVMLTHRNLVANVEQIATPADFTEGDVTIAVLPFFHIYGMQVLMNGALSRGVTVVTMPRFDLDEFLRIHQDYGITRSFVAPPIVVALAKHPMVDQYDLSSLTQILSGAAPLSAELALEAGARLDCEVVQGYGMTELSPVSHITPPGWFKPGSAGVTVSNTEVMIVDPLSGESLDVDRDGEVWIRGPQVMKGYLNNTAATEATIDDDGWLHTGDMGHMDGGGHLFVVDRLKELIKYKGFQVPPAELEALLLTHPSVADAAVIGVPDEEAGEIPMAFIAARPNVDVTAQEIMDFVAGEVASYKHVRKIEFVDAIPKSASGKILRRMLRDKVSDG